MTIGLLATADLAAATDVNIYTTPSGHHSVITINACNRRSSSVLLRIAVSSGGSPISRDYIEYDLLLTSHAVLERTSILVSEGRSIIVRSSSAGVTVTAWGIENPVGTVVTVPGPPAPASYAVTPGALSVDEGNLLSFTVTTTGVSDGTTLFYTVSAASDFSTASGSFSIASGSGLFSVTPSLDLTTEGSETFTVSIRTASITGPVVATSAAVTIADTSVTPSNDSVIRQSGTAPQLLTVTSTRLIGQLSAAEAAFGSRSLLGTQVIGFSGRANAVNVPLSSALTAPFTMEGWVYVQTGSPDILLQGPTETDLAATAPSNYIRIQALAGGSATVSYTVEQGGSTLINGNDVGNPATTAGQWLHLALVVGTGGTNWSVWLNGSRRVNNLTFSTPFTATMNFLTLNPFGIGVQQSYIDEIRISNVARYTLTDSTITVPSSEFTSDANTLALIKFE
jgi:hypothetical protein